MSAGRASWWGNLVDRASGYFSSADRIVAGATAEDAETQKQARRAAIEDAPIIWLLGKVQTGKSSIVHHLTGASAAEIGEGFRPHTRTAAIFDFPQEAPLLRFLDTRGLGETGYDPSGDIAAGEDKAHLLIVTLRASDPAQHEVIDIVRGIRRRHPNWPVIVAQTWLHALYPRPPAHSMPYPFTGIEHDASLPGVPPDLSRALMHQRKLFEGMRGDTPIRFVPLDFTRPEDGLAPEDYGLEALLAAIEAAAPEAVQARLTELRAGANDAIGASARGLILGYASAAAAADLLPALGTIAVPGIQGAMLHAVAGRFAITWDRTDISSFLGSLGTAALLHYGVGFGVRQLIKLIPVYGQTVGAATAAAASFAFTYALGRAACVYLGMRRDDRQTDVTATLQAYRDGLQEAIGLFQRRRKGGA